MGDIFNQIFYQPLFNLLIVIYSFVPGNDLGVAIILLTVLVKLILAPLSWKQIVAQKALQDLQPKLEEIKKEHKDDKQALMQAQMKLFQEHKINPLSSCLPLLVQLPFLIALYYVFVNGLKTESFSMLYGFVPHPETLNTTFFGFLSLTETKNILLAIVTGAAQFWQAKMLMTKKPPKVPGSKDETFATMLNQQMLYVMPAFTALIVYQFPSGLGLYWLTQSVLSVAQQHLFLRFQNAKKQ
ncbi:membrane protein insertase YidC [Candidatus Uhrbacteria bacterium]|nr:membrane protein insertase YidC [Candidatus Uhrbacteria bacterium]